MSNFKNYIETVRIMQRRFDRKYTKKLTAFTYCWLALHVAVAIYLDRKWKK